MDGDARRRGALLGLLSALLFGLGAPVSKLLLPGAGPLTLSGFLYLGAASAFFAVPRSNREAPLSRADLPSLIGSIVAGAALAPPLLLFGLSRVSGLSGSLLLNLEAPFTIGIAVLLFGEHLSAKEGLAAALVVAGGAILGARGHWGGSLTGVIAIALSSLAWAVDNNLSARLSLKDPVQLLRIKALAAAALNLGLGLLLAQRLPRSATAVLALALGSVSYGASLLFYLRAQRLLGAARQGALFAAAPFAGALLSIPLLGDRPAAADLGAALLMASGVTLLLRARHGHRHLHEALEHEHEHVHDEHHHHPHRPDVLEPHSHPHRHDALEHEHPHVSDAHHRHRH